MYNIIRLIYCSYICLNSYLCATLSDLYIVVISVFISYLCRTLSDLYIVVILVLAAICAPHCQIYLLQLFLSCQLFVFHIVRFYIILIFFLSAICVPQCQNGGSCLYPYFCVCPPGTYGIVCEKCEYLM